MTDAWQSQANHFYERATFAADPQALNEGEALLDAVEADLALARGRLLHARFLAVQAAEAGRMDEATAMLAEAEQLAGSAQGVRNWIAATRAEVDG